MPFGVRTLISVVDYLLVGVCCKSGRSTSTALPFASEAHSQNISLISKIEQTIDVLVIDLGEVLTWTSPALIC